MLGRKPGTSAGEVGDVHNERGGVTLSRLAVSMPRGSGGVIGVPPDVIARELRGMGDFVDVIDLEITAGWSGVLTEGRVAVKLDDGFIADDNGFVFFVAEEGDVCSVQRFRHRG